MLLSACIGYIFILIYFTLRVYYYKYQILRINEIQRITTYLIESNDIRIINTFVNGGVNKENFNNLLNSVYKPSLKNYFGLKFPTEKDFK